MLEGYIRKLYGIYLPFPVTLNDPNCAKPIYFLKFASLFLSLEQVKIET